MKVLGVDPGSHNTGWGVIRRQGNALHGLAAGVIRAPKDGELPARLQVIHRELRKVIEEHQPDCMAVEDVFSKYARSALLLGQARGVILLTGAEAQLAIRAYPPAVVKRSIAGSGQAPKGQLGRMVCALLGWKTLPAADATDALAIAITHANASRAELRTRR